MSAAAVLSLISKLTPEEREAFNAFAADARREPAPWTLSAEELVDRLEALVTIAVRYRLEAEVHNDAIAALAAEMVTICKAEIRQRLERGT